MVLAKKERERKREECVFSDALLVNTEMYSQCIKSLQICHFSDISRSIHFHSLCCPDSYPLLRVFFLLLTMSAGFSHNLDFRLLH